MTHFAGIKKVVMHIFMCIALTVFPGCGQIDNSGVNAQNYEEINSLIPVEIWLNSAQDLLKTSLTSQNYYRLLTETESHKSILSMYFDKTGELKMARVKDFLGISNTLLFEEKRLAYSQHEDSSGKVWILAYANNQPYACATSVEERWSAIEPSMAPINKELINESRAIARDYEEKERNPKVQRILADNTRVERAVSFLNPVTYKLNLQAGDELDLALKNTSKEVFFALSNLTSAQMEYKTWNGKIEKTGDISIQVFSTSQDSAPIPFQLDLQIQPANPS